jgi:hypothetical protein
MMRMGRRIALVGVVFALWIATNGRIHSQVFTTVSDNPQPCNAPPVSKNPDSPTMDVSIAEISFWGSGLQMPASDQDEIAAKVKNLRHDLSEGNLTDEALNIAREEWQTHGYFQARVTGETKTVSSNAISKRLSLSVHVEEGLQYRLQEIAFKYYELFYAKTLRSLFPIDDGEVVERSKIAKGLENLKQAYANQGFVNYTSIPVPRYDDANRLMSWEIEIDEGKQFILRNVQIQGLDEGGRQKVLDSFLLKPNQVFNEHLLQLSLERQELPECSCDRVQRHLDDNNGTVDIALDFRPCN